MADKDNEEYPGDYLDAPSVPMASDKTLRDWFAGQALIGLVLRGLLPDRSDLGAETAYVFAGAMMHEREKKDEDEEA